MTRSVVPAAVRKKCFFPLPFTSFLGSLADAGGGASAGEEAGLVEAGTPSSDEGVEYAFGAGARPASSPAVDPDDAVIRARQRAHASAGRRLEREARALILILEALRGSGAAYADRRASLHDAVDRGICLSRRGVPARLGSGARG